MRNLDAGPAPSHAWKGLPATPVGPGGGRAAGTDYLRSGLTSVELSVWAELVGTRLGLHFPLPRIHQLSTALAQRMKANRLTSIAMYRGLLETEPAEWDRLAGALTVSETRFFRQKDMFTALRSEILSKIVRRRMQAGTPSLRLWSAGCSTGDEAYSLAMTALEAVNFPWLWNVSVLGTDISLPAIETAQKGLFDELRIRDVPATSRDGYLERLTAHGQVEVTQKLRDVVQFRLHNLTGAAWPLPGYDVIVCQNVLLYLLPELRLPVLTRLYTSLLPGGYLIVGPAEMPSGPLPGGVRPASCGGVLVYRRS